MHSFFKRLITATRVLLALLLFSTAAKIHAQAVSIASVTGRVTDPSGAVISGAQVKITALSTNSVYSAVTGADGLFNFPSLSIGAYTLEVTAPGFQTYSQKGISLQVNEAAQVYVTLKVGEEPTEPLRKELVQWVRKEIGPFASPDLIQFSPGLPKTRSGKIMRRILRKIAEDDFGNLGDTTTLADPAVVDDLVNNRQNKRAAKAGA